MRLLLFLCYGCAIFTAPVLLWAQAVRYPAEGFDRQSPEEIEKARAEIKRLFSDAVLPELLSGGEKIAVLGKYQHLDPRGEVPADLLQTAVLYFDRNKSKFPNQSHITVIDFGARSDNQRFFVIDMVSGAVEKFRVAHGWGSDRDRDGYAEAFGNVEGSGMSSLGFIRTAEVYYGDFKRSVRLDGLSSSNSRVRQRAIVLHGWDGVQEAPVIQNWSWGCPALDWAVKDRVIDKVKEGSLIYMGVSGKLAALSSDIYH